MIGLTLLGSVLSLFVLASPDLTGTWRGTMTMDGRSIEIVGWFEPDGEELSATLHVPALGAMNLAFSGQRQNHEVELRSPMPGGPLVLEGTLLEGDRLRGRWSWTGQSGELSLSRRETHRLFREEPVSFRSSDGTSLAGTVLIPQGEGPFPAVVWVHGSGGIGRRSEDYIREPYALALRGVAAIVYDKRGVGDSGGDWRSATFHDLARDALAARSALLERGEIDADRVGIGGISQGPSWIAPLACHLGADFRFVIALSAAIVTPAEQHLYVVRQRMLRAGHGEDEIARALALHRRFDAWQQAPADGRPKSDELERDLVAAKEFAWGEAALLPATPLVAYPESVRAWMWLDPVPWWRELDVRVFAAWGASDDITDPESGPELLAPLVGDSLEAHRYEGADHVLRLIVPRPPAPVAPSLHDDLIRWIEVGSR
ncbi:MAG: alpha/beta hydrolase [Planctomycetota bacterium]